MASSQTSLDPFIQTALTMLEEILGKRKSLVDDPVKGVNGTSDGRIMRSRTGGYWSGVGGGGRVGGRALSTSEKELDVYEHEAGALRSLFARVSLSPEQRKELDLRLKELEERYRPIDSEFGFCRPPNSIV